MVYIKIINFVLQRCCFPCQQEDVIIKDKIAVSNSNDEQKNETNPQGNNNTILFI